MDSRITELAEKVERLAKEHVICRRENARLKRLLQAAEAKIKDLSGAGGAEAGQVPDLTRQVEKMKAERKLIKDKVEKMAAKLDKFYQE